jgi:hypothetical protein
MESFHLAQGGGKRSVSVNTVKTLQISHNAGTILTSKGPLPTQKTLWSMELINQLSAINCNTTYFCTFVYITPSVKNLLPPSLLTEVIETKIYRTIILPFVPYVPVTLREKYRMVCCTELVKCFPPFLSGYHACEMEVKWRLQHNV